MKNENLSFFKENIYSSDLELNGLHSDQREYYLTSPAWELKG